MTPPTLEEWRRWSACHDRNYTDGPIKKHLLIGTGPEPGTGAEKTPHITELIGEKASA